MDEDKTGRPPHPMPAKGQHWILDEDPTTEIQIFHISDSGKTVTGWKIINGKLVIRQRVVTVRVLHRDWSLKLQAANPYPYNLAG